MAQWHTIQSDFSHGEVTAKLMLRGKEVVGKAVAEMVNFMPNTVGTVERTPGTRFFQQLAEDEARIIPFMSTANERSLVLMTDQRLRMFPNIADQLHPNFVYTPGGGTVTFRKNIVPNSRFRGGPDPWILSPGELQEPNGDRFGSYWGPGAIHLLPKIEGSHDKNKVTTASVVATVDEPTDVVTVDFQLELRSLRPLDAKYDIFVDIKAGGTSLPDFPLKLDSDKAGGFVWEIQKNVALPTNGWTGDLDILVSNTAIAANNGNSLPRLTMVKFEVFADGTTDLTEVDIVTPYLKKDLADIHFVQSPYADKELVLVHPRHPPQRFYFQAVPAADYVIEDIPFTGDTMPAWSENNYPSCCTSYHGRLVMAGGQQKPTLATPVASVTETVWGTEVGDWTKFSDAGEVDPDDSIEFTAVYRSPIQWVFGQKALLVGAQEMEYSASGEGIFSPGDLGVFLHSTHGSTNVQPASVGSGVLFPSDNGRRVRLMDFDDKSEGWVAQEASALNPYLFTEGIVRMVRLRNPHQMCAVLTNNGIINLFHMEGPLSGWSRMIMTNANVKDICVVPDDDGVDILYMIIKRETEGAFSLNLEAIPNWISGKEWDFLSSSKLYNMTTETNVLDGLEHLEGKYVQVVVDNQYLGMWQVVNGEVTLSDGTGHAIFVTFALVGLPNMARLRLMAPEKSDPMAKARYSSFAIRTVFSTRPIMFVVGQPDNRERPPERDPVIAMNRSQILDVLDQSHYHKLDWDPVNMLEIRENLPLRCEIIGVFGKLTQNSL